MQAGARQKENKQKPKRKFRFGERSWKVGSKVKRSYLDRENVLWIPENLPHLKVHVNSPSCTLSVAVPDSILDNVLSEELRTYLIGQLARTLTIFKVDEVVIYSEEEQKFVQDSATSTNGKSSKNNSLWFLSQVLKYLETPQYLRKHLFERSDEFKYAGLLNPIDAPHHIRRNEWLSWREGVVLNKLKENSERHCYEVDIGLYAPVRVENDFPLSLGSRITVSLDDQAREAFSSLQSNATTNNYPVIYANLCDRETPKKMGSLYWGYSTRTATSLSKAWEDCPFEGGYDIIIGTSERGRSIDDSNFVIPPCRHLLLVFGGKRGLEYSASRDDVLHVKGVGRNFTVGELFHDYVNVCPFQGSRTIRTEEAVMIALSRLQPLLTCVKYKSKPKHKSA
eukprot:jgi/Galph1/505/GphlegSOOS_G5189.1